MAKRDQLICKTPAGCYGKWFRDGLPCGNGKIGVLVHGGIEEETLVINHSQLWHWGKNTPVPDVHEALARTRCLIDQGDYAAANPVTSKALLDKGYDSSLFKPCPLADLKVTLDDCEAFSDYRRILHMDRAEIETRWKFQDTAYSRRCFVSRKRDLFVFTQSCEDAADGRIALGLHQSYGPDTRRMEEECRDTLTITSHGEYLYYSLRNDDGRDCGIVLKVVGDVCISKGDEGTLLYHGMKHMTVIGQVFIGCPREEAFRNIHHDLEKLSVDYETLLREHVLLHKKLYAGSEIRLADSGFSVSNEQLLLDAYDRTPSNAMLEKLWRFGRYLFICSSCEEGLPMPLYGLWHGEYDAIWSHNMANINIQMIYWHSFANNLLGMNRAFIDYYFGLMDQFRENARQLFGMRGIYLSAGSTPGFGRINQVVPVITNWIAAAGWIANHFYKYYLYTNDRAYLEEKILPFMMEAAEFYEDYLVYDRNGVLRCYPSVSPENTPGNLMPDADVNAMDHACPTCENATLDFAVMKELLQNLLSLSSVVEMDKGKISSYQRLLQAMPSYQYNEDGSVKEWLKEELKENHFHRHISHLYPVFPGEEVDARRDPELGEHFLKAVENRELGGQTGWSFCHTACVLTRLGQPEKAMKFMEILARSCVTNSFLTMHNDWRKMGMSLNLDSLSPIQLDANLGYVAVIQEMLFSVVKGYVRILPALPQRFPQGSVQGFISPGAEFSFSWSNEKFYMEIKVENNRNVEVELPEQYGEYLCKAPSETVWIMENRHLKIKNTGKHKIQIGVEGKPEYKK